MLLSGFKTKAIIIDWHLDAAELKLRHTETPQITSASGVRVKLKAAGVNPLDTKLRSGADPLQQFPLILGCGGAKVRCSFPQRVQVIIVFCSEDDARTQTESSTQHVVEATTGRQIAGTVFRSLRARERHHLRVFVEDVAYLCKQLSL